MHQQLAALSLVHQPVTQEAFDQRVEVDGMAFAGLASTKEIGYPSNRYLNLINCFFPPLETQPYQIALFLVPGKQQHCSL